MFLTAFALSGCRGDDVDGPEGPATEGKIIYNIKVVDAFGAPVPDMIVNLFCGDDSVAVKITNSEGVVKCDDDDALADGSYTFKIIDPHNKPFYYDESVCTLKDGEETVTVTLYSTTDGLINENLYPADSSNDEPVAAPALRDGGYHLELAKGKNYFVFVPTVRGRYHIEIINNDDLTVGYHGSPFFVQPNDLAGNTVGDAVFRTEEGLFFDIRSFNIGEDYASTSRYVLMIEAENDTDAIVTVKCVEDIPLSVEELPWDDITLSEEPKDYVPEFDTDDGYVFEYVDITDENLTIVYNSADGFYHVGSADGPVVLVQLTVASRYLDASFSKIAETASFTCYVYGDDGELIAKRNYHNMMLKYIEKAHAELGVYPLTEGIKNALIDIGNAWGWYEEDGINNIFGEDAPSVIAENAYLFACGYLTDPEGEATVLPEYGNKIGNRAYDYEFDYIIGSDKVKLSDLVGKGKKIIINFWGTWCPYCLYEMPDFDAVAKKYGDKVTVLAVHTTSYSSNNTPTDYINESFKDSDINFVFDKRQDGKSLDEYYSMLGGTGSYPLTVVLDENGVITFIKLGMMSYEEMISALGISEEE